ncbi:Invertase [Wickerhamomyces ciferrii]|uniref:Invertase n=1 Tax=Wickerhamomyces ciferrii (strain ATCC 14091 / BCRC 22168 / CBS 111 / JCM 3599 / NBRC 0793 / NRRL Y-1031 F-60-10) TaxID=1206466 RepID=K0KK50_WICCF|nr:Invertase [Wickerhamomyces ciferrii]CCH43291.1 Invertase [Wickerhamomyces ciferrii]
MVQLQFTLLLSILSSFTGLAAAKAGDIGTASNVQDNDKLRPQFHLTPGKGWMNDPDGLWYDRKEKLWHAYYQHNPDHNIWNSPISWGHSVSPDLVSWYYYGNALTPEDSSIGFFSGSIVVDRNNTSGFFDDSVDPDQRVVAMYTKNTDKETQELAYSKDGGFEWEYYSQNPVININTAQQRDPKIIWHEDSQKWVALIARTQKFAIQIWTSKDLKNWEHVSDFEKEGILGFQYEMPGLLKLPVENPSKGDGKTHKWVMFVALHPGSPIGGPLNQYFIGDFDGETFTPDDHATRIQDYGRDYYSFTTFDSANPADGPNLGLAWATNWQYATIVPTENYRSSMTQVRNYTLRNVDYNPEYTDLTLIQTPVLETYETKQNESLKTWTQTQEYSKNNFDLDSSSTVNTNFNGHNNASGVLDFNMTFVITSGKGWSDGLSPFTITINSDQVNGKSDNISVTFDASGQTWVVDRTTTHAFQRNQHEFGERMGQYVNPRGYRDTGAYYSVYGFVDRSMLELYFNDGEMTMTNTFFLADGRVPADITVNCGFDDSFIHVEEFKAKAYALKSNVNVDNRNPFEKAADDVKELIEKLLPSKSNN